MYKNFKGFLQGDIEGEDGEKIFKDEADLERAIVANILILFIGGFDTSSTMASATVQYDDKNGFLVKIKIGRNFRVQTLSNSLTP